MTGIGGGRPGRRAGAALVVLIAALSLGADSCEPPPAPCPEGFEPVVLPEFMVGFSQVPADAVRIAQEIGVRYLRPTLSWRTVEPTVEVLGLTVEAIRADPAIVSDYAAGRSWASFDARLQEIVDADLVPFPIVGHGYVGTLARHDGVPADADVIGRADYLAHMYLFTRATVERYDADGVDDVPSGLRVSYWQTENELNQAFFTALWGWRSPSFLDALGSAWQDWDFVTELLETLRLAVLDADPTALTTMNFHTDIPASLNEGLGQPSWETAVERWRGSMDILGVDAYPNYYAPDPVRGAVVGERVARVAELGCGMPVVVMETGYPTGPSIVGFDEARQAEYITDAFQSSVRAGAAGYFNFGAKTADEHTVEITDEDLANLALLAAAYDEGDLGALLSFALLNLDYVVGHFSEVLKAVEPYWGLERPDGSHKPGWRVLARLTALYGP